MCNRMKPEDNYPFMVTFDRVSRTISNQISTAEGNLGVDLDLQSTLTYAVEHVGNEGTVAFVPIPKSRIYRVV